MIKKSLALILLLFTASNLFSQDLASQDSIRKPALRLSYLDSLKTTYVIDEMTSCVDSLWIKEQTSNQKIFDDLYADIKNINLDQTVDYELPTELLKERLRLMDEKSPFNIEYNVGLENIIKSFLKNRKHSFERLMGISQYYFPMFEEAMAKYNVPLEIKYLAVVESALNPKATSRVGATGLWQFMYQTGKQYNLGIDSYVDERSDALKSSDAAARYMQKMFEVFGDWDLVLASYNSGPGNVAKAIRRSGGHQNYWNIRKNLPKETQGYVPAFLATMYIFEYHKEHGIVPEKPVASTFTTDTIAVKNKMTFKQIADLLDMPVAEIEFLNPSYKLKVIPYVTHELHFLRLPKDKIAIFTSNEDKMYAYANYDFSKRERPFTSKPRLVRERDTISSKNDLENALADTETKRIMKTVSRTKFHTVRKGDNLSDIAEKYDVAMSDLKKWNHLKSNKVQSGKKLKIVTEDRIAVVQKVKKPKLNTDVAKAVITENNSDKAVASAEKGSTSKKETAKSALKENKQEVTDKSNATAEYIVKAGDNLFSIAKENKVTVADLKKWNAFTENTNVYAGDRLKISGGNTLPETKSNIETIVYAVKKGDNIAVIAQKNEVTVANLKKWNDLNSNVVKLGEKLKIEKVTEVVAEVSKKDLKKSSKYQEQKLYIVQKGDSLFSISQEHHTTVADIKKLNDIKDENLQPGMKLKIKG